jgi:hypothetical protein
MRLLFAQVSPFVRRNVLVWCWIASMARRSSIKRKTSPTCCNVLASVPWDSCSHDSNRSLPTLRQTAWIWMRTKASKWAQDCCNFHRIAPMSVLINCLRTRCCWNPTSLRVIRPIGQTLTIQEWNFWSVSSTTSLLSACHLSDISVWLPSNFVQRAVTKTDKGP